MRLSLLDLAPVRAGGDARRAFAEAVALARHVEALGFVRCWYAEHHGGGGRVASVAPEVLVGRVAAATERVRVGSGAVLLNHQSPLKVAEVFCSLHALHPGRVDLGVGRANSRPSTDRALLARRDAEPYPDDHAGRIAELLAWLGRGFAAGHEFAEVALPAAGVPGGPQPWVLGSTPTSAPVAGALGLPYCFAGQINPNLAETAAADYRAAFRPSTRAGGIAEPCFALAIGVAVGEDDEDGLRLRAPGDLLQVQAARGGPPPGPAPSTAEARAGLDALGLRPGLEDLVAGAWPRTVAGSPERVAGDLRAMAALTGADELVLQDQVGEPDARRDGYARLAAALADG